MTEVVLGVPGPWAENNLEASDHYTTKIGGIPDWSFLESSLGLELRKCNSCGSELYLIAQVYAPVTTVDVKIEERVIYVFGCTDVRCGSWRAIRVQKPDTCEEPNSIESEPSASASSVTPTSNSEWLDDLFSFDLGSGDTGEKENMSMDDLARAFSEAANLGSSSVKEASKGLAETCNKSLPSVPEATRAHGPTLVLPCFYICYQGDKILAVEGYEYNGDDIQEESWAKEGYEYDKALHADRTYLKFKKKLDACPQQCIRYSFGGKPLLATRGAIDSRPCGLCGESRQYEMQLMPPLVYFLQEGADRVQRSLLDSWSWMTLMVFTCSKCCFQKSDQKLSDTNGWTVAEEIVIPQYE